MMLGSGLVRVQVGTGGSGYSSAPTVTLSGGGGSGAACVAQMAGTRVEAVVITDAGTGYTSAPTITLSGGGGSGAAATAMVVSQTTPMCLFQGRFGDLYGVNGLGRGMRWDGQTPSLEAIGISKPLSAATVSITAATTAGYVRSVAIVNGGAGYFAPPTATFKGGGLTDGDPNHATARAKIMNARVIGMTVDSRGGGYSSTPTITLEGGNGGGAVLNVGVSGKILSIEVLGSGSGYTSVGGNAATVSLAGITGAAARLIIGDGGRVESVSLLAAGTGATTTPTLTINAPIGSGATITPVMEYTVTAVTCKTTQAGTGYVTPPAVSFTPSGGSAQARATVANGGVVSPLEIVSGGAYSSPPTAAINSATATAMAVIGSPMSGVYRCCYRYIDDTPDSRQGPIPSSISDLTQVVAGEDAAVFRWQWSNDGMESRADKIELWRTTADQAIVLYRVATISKVAGAMPTSYVDNLTDDQLLDPERADFGMMPIVMPSGQLNARRFDPPPVKCSQAVMFQDRAWYSVDVTGERPNSLWHSEIDEPESTPEVYEIVVQESLGESDAIVGLLPMGAELLILQRRHMYRLQYVSQPLLDASVRLATSRGALNARCYAVLAGVAYIVDGQGMYSYSGDQREDVSAPVDNYWRDGIIDFSKNATFHVQSDRQEAVIRFFYCRSGDGTYPTRALCYCANTKAWWEESYPHAVPAGVVVNKSGRPISLYATAGGQFVSPQVGQLDAGDTAIPYEYRTGNHSLTDSQTRQIGVLYTPTAVTANLGLRLHYNGSTSSRPNSIVSARGDGVEQAAGGAVIDMRSMRSSLGVAPGFVQVLYSGRLDDRSSGGDRHLAVALTGSQSQASPVVLHSLRIAGVTA